MAAKILTLDIETAPMKVWTWGLWKQDISIGQVIEPGRVLGVGFKWLDAKRPDFYSEHTLGADTMIVETHALLNEADVVIHFNGKTFDMPHLNREFHRLRLGPTSSYMQIDLLKEVKGHFRMDSNKLDYVGQYFGVGEKVKHEGFGLWKSCLDGDSKAWARMERYCKGDVVLTEKLYRELLPWISDAPASGLFEDDIAVDQCDRCGGINLIKEGYAYTKLARFQRFHCEDCGRWLRSGRAEKRVDLRGVAA